MAGKGKSVRRKPQTAAPDTARRKSEGERPRLDEEFFRAITDNSQNGVLVLNKDGTVRFENAFMERMLGHKWVERIGKSAFEPIHPDDLPGAMSAFAELIQNRGGTAQLAFRARHQDGSWRFLQGSGRNLLNDPTVQGIVVSIHDITDRKQAEEALESSEQRFRRLAEDMNDGYCVLRGARIVFANSRVATMFGYTSHEVVGKTVYDLLPLEIVDDLAKKSVKRRRGGKAPQQYEATLVNKDGTARPVEFGVSATEYDGKPALSVLVRDITERKQAEQALRESEEKYRLIVSEVEDYAIFMLNPDGTIASWNEGAQRIKGYTSEEIIGKHFSCFYTGEDNESGKPDEELEVVAAEGRLEDEGWRVRKDGSKFWANVVITALRDESGKLVGYSKVTRDISDRKQAEEATRLAHADLDQVFNTTASALLVVDKDSNVLRANQAFARLAGIGTDEAVGSKCHEVLPSAMCHTDGCTLARIMGGAERVEHDVEKERRDGVKVHCLLVATPYTGADGQPIGMVQSLTDITERKQVEEALRSSEQGFKRLAEDMNDGYCVFRGPRVVFANSRVAKMFGYTPEEVVGKTVHDLLPPETIWALAGTSEKRRRGRMAPQQYETTLVGKDGEARPVELGVTETEYGGEPALSVLVRDITERKQAEDELRRLAWAVDSATDGVGVADVAGRSVYHNEALVQLLGYTVPELNAAGGPPVIYKSPDVAREMFETIMSGGSWTGEVEMISRAGRELAVSLRANSIKDSEGRVTGLVGIHTDVTERKLAEEALQKSEERYRLLLESVTDSVYVLDRDWRHVIVNDAAEQFVGMPKQRLLENKLTDLFPGVEQTEFFKVFQRVMETRNPDSVVNEYVFEDGRRGWYEVNVYPVPEGILCISRDISDRKQAEEAVRTQRDLGMALTTASGLDEGLRSCLQAAMRISGMDCGGVYLVDSNTGAFYLALHEGLPQDFVAAASRFEADSDRARIVQEGKPVYVMHQELGVPLEGAEQREALRATAHIPVSHHDEVIACLSVASHAQDEVPPSARDALELMAAQIGSSIARLRAEEALRLNEERYRILAENVTDVITSTDLNLNPTYMSPSITRLLGFSVEETMSRTFEESLTPASHELAMVKLAKQLELDPEGHDPGTGSAGTELEFYRKDGSTVWVEVRVSFLRDSNGNPVGLVNMLRDVTERRKAQEERQRMEQQVQLAGRLAAVGELAAGVAHELNNPLAAVQGFAQLLTSRDDLDESMRADVETIFKEAKRASKITTNLLSFARRHKPERHFASINEAISQSLELHAYRLKVNNVEICTELDPNLPMTMADSHQMQQVFVNLVTNAEQAMTEANGKGKLIVRTEAAGDLIRITFADDGPGIPEENLSTIFDPFFTTKAVGKGTGLGLSICFGIVEQHGGRMCARSEPGEGATFVIELPVVSTAQAMSEESDSDRLETVQGG